jgi:uncharacterized repeat protein (TIGR01451 family)
MSAPGWVKYWYNVTNCGDTTLENITVADSRIGPVTAGITDPLAPDGYFNASKEYYVTQDDIDACMNITNTAAVEANGCGDIDNSSAAVEVVIEGIDCLNIVKSATPLTVTVSGQTINYNYNVTNCGTTTIDTISIIDSKGLPISGVPASLAPGAHFIATASYIVSQADIDACGDIINTANVTGTGCGIIDPVTSNTVTVENNALASMNLTYTANTAGPVSAGQIIEYTIKICNNGAITLNNVQVVDSLTGTYTITTLAPGVCNTAKKTYTVTAADINNGEVVNSVTATTIVCGNTLSRNGQLTLPTEQVGCCECPTVVDFSATKTASLTMKFTDQSSGNPVQWIWNFGDGKSSTERNPVHKYSRSGTYKVTLYVRSQDCEGALSGLTYVSKSISVTR